MAEPLAWRGRWWVPGNRWDLVAPIVDGATPASVSIVIPYFEQPDSLRRLYAALSLSGLERGRDEVVVVDDGSAEEPPAPELEVGVPVRFLRQEDRGCRPGAARNLGVEATQGDVLVFLDADTLPAPATINRLAAWPATAPDAVVVGRRHHADLAGWTPGQVVEWLGHGGRPPRRRADPAWLDDGYRRTGDLLTAGECGYRYVISAVMSCSRHLFEDVGGFDGARDQYGGEDWELAFRAFNNGALLVHDPAAVAWHDEPDRAERDGSGLDTNPETLWLASVIPEPAARSQGIIQPFAATVIELSLPAACSAGQLVATIDSLLAELFDVSVHVTTPAPPAVAEHVRADSRVRWCTPTCAERRRARTTITIGAPLRWSSGRLRALVDRVREQEIAALHLVAGEREVAVVRSTRTEGRRRRATTFGVPPAALDELLPVEQAELDDVGATLLTGEVDLQAHFGGWAEPRSERLRDGFGRSVRGAQSS